LTQIRILGVSDFITPAPTAAPVDLILSCGDLPPEHLTQLASSLEAPVFFVCGNHDLRFQERPPEGCTNLHSRLLEYKGLRLAGLEGSRWYNGGPYQYTEGEMQVLARRLGGEIRRRGGVDVVISHAPPRHVHDREDPCHQGFVSFHRLIARHAPRFHLHGHVHSAFAEPGERVTMVHRTRVVNCSGAYLLELDYEGMQK
jgi:Icc-related predicted phosphoesterase